jgi:purine-cytosine permease-like protein
MPKINILGYRFGVPRHPLPRVVLGCAMVVGGLVGFLPVVGFWMVPVGLAILAVDFPPVRRFHRRMTVRFGNWLHRRWPRLAGLLGYGNPRPERRG